MGCLPKSEQSNEEISDCLERRNRQRFGPMFVVGKSEDSLEIAIQFAIGVDDVGSSAPVGPVGERSHENQPSFIRVVKQPPVYLSRTDVHDSPRGNADALEVDVVEARPARAANEELELGSLVKTQLGLAYPLHETGEREGFQRKTSSGRRVRHRNEVRVTACRVLVSQWSESGIPLRLVNCFNNRAFRHSRRETWSSRQLIAIQRSLEMTRKIDNAIALYMEGIRDGNAREAVTKYTGDRYTQHSTGVRDGVDGFVEFFEPFLANNPDREIRVVRAIEDGNFVFVHVSQSLNGGEAKWITMDMFDTSEDDLIVEHWDVITEWVDETVSGHSQIDGPTDVEDLDKTEQNRSVVNRFVNEILIGGGQNFTDFISTETYIQHNPQVADGLEGFGDFVAELAAAGTSMVYKYSYKVLAQGNFAVAYSLAQIGEEDVAVFDLFRLADGFIVEHWDAMEPLPRGDDLVNQGKF